MNEPPGEVQAVVGHVNEAHGTDYRVQRRLAGGYQNGAYELRSRRAGRAVMKVSADPAWAPRVLGAAPLVARARAAGWPTPAWLFVGVTALGWPYCVQDWVDGSPMRSLGDNELDQLTELVELQAGLAPATDVDWAAYNRRVVFQGEGRVPDRVAASGPAGAQIVTRFQSLCARYADEVTPSADLVHGDLGSSNVLMRAGKAVAVIDVEALGKGHRVSDYACLLREGYMDGADRKVLQAPRRPRRYRGGGAALTVSCTATSFLVAAFVLDNLPRKWDEKCVGLLHLVADLGG